MQAAVPLSVYHVIFAPTTVTPSTVVTAVSGAAASAQTSATATIADDIQCGEGDWVGCLGATTFTIAC